jgi:hypothetical protein
MKKLNAIVRWKRPQLPANTPSQQRGYSIAPCDQFPAGYSGLYIHHAFRNHNKVQENRGQMATHGTSDGGNSKNKQHASTTQEQPRHARSFRCSDIKTRYSSTAITRKTIHATEMNQRTPSRRMRDHVLRTRTGACMDIPLK